MVLSAEDAVTDAMVSQEWFCSQRVTPRHLVWYSRFPDAPFPSCRCTVERRDPSSNESQVCVTVRPSACVLPRTSPNGRSPEPSPEVCQTNPFAGRNGNAGQAILDLAHVALLAAPSNPRYGVNTELHDCLHYSLQKETPEAKACVGATDDESRRFVRYGEVSDGNLENYILRRLTYNPDFDHMACLLYTSPSPRDQRGSRMPSSA